MSTDVGVQVSSLAPKKDPSIRMGLFLVLERERRLECVIAQAGGLCMSRCAHWRILLFCFPVPPQGKTKCQQVSASKQDCKVMRPHKAQPHRPAALFFLFSREPPSLGSRLSIVLSSTRLQNRRFCVSQELRRGAHRPVFTPAWNECL